MWWTSLALAASIEVLGDPAFRAPDGIVDAAVVDDGSVWTLSPRGQVAGFAPDGALRTTFQACPDRGERVEFAVSADGRRLGLACTVDFRVYDLPEGRLLHTFDVDTTHAALSIEGHLLGILGERYAGDHSEDESWLLVYDLRTGEITRTILGEWDRVFAVQRGWVLARGNDRGTELSLTGAIRQPGGGLETWTHEVPRASISGGGHTPRTSLSVRQRGANLCIRTDDGGTCLQAMNGRPSRPWVTVDRPFAAPGEGSRIDSAGGRHALEVLPTHLRREGTGWTDVARVLVGGDRVHVVEADGTVFDARNGTVLGRTTGEAALSPDGRWAWRQDAEGSWRQDLVVGSPPEALPALSHAVVTDEGTVHGLVTGRRGASLVSLPVGGEPVDRGRLGKRYQPSGLQLVGERALVTFDQDDRYITFPLDDPGAVEEARHVFGLDGDVRLTAGGVVATDEIAEPRLAAGVEVPDHAIVRFLDDGRIVVLEEDAPRLVLKSADGATTSTVELPGRADAAWVVPGGVAVALRDGRVAVVTVP
jgi:hypothetical protein